MTKKSDYIRSDELGDAIVPLADLPGLFGVNERTIRRWITADDITTFPNPLHPPGVEGTTPLAVRWGDVPIGAHATRWRSRNDVRQP